MSRRGITRTVYLLPEQWTFIDQAVKQSGMTKAAFLRNAVLAYAGEIMQRNGQYGSNSSAFSSGNGSLNLTDLGQERLLKSVLLSRTIVARVLAQMVSPEEYERTIEDAKQQVMDELEEDGLIFNLN